MTRRVIVNLYLRDMADTYKCTLIETRDFFASMTTKEIVNHLDIGNFFEMNLIEGDKFCCVDFGYLGQDVEFAKALIHSIPADEAATQRISDFYNFFVVEDKSDDYVLHDCNGYIHEYSRFECGATSCDDLITWASSHPWMMVVVSGVVWDLIKSCLKFIFKLFRKNVSVRKRKIIVFNQKNFFNNISKLISCDISNLQIQSLNRTSASCVEIKLRTTDNRIFIAQSNKKGQILKLEEKTLIEWLNGFI
jgi:hypothetical protein